ncbi:MAG: hypothetical protein QOH35_507 [Acidobacteriaceae bacterium]|jgi:hypothetical protein|nr:hypothetical protein [Acidobacteriaceae bacterium]
MLAAGSPAADIQKDRFGIVLSWCWLLHASRFSQAPLFPIISEYVQGNKESYTWILRSLVFLR